MSDKYILDERGEPQPVGDVVTWAQWFERASRDRSRVIQQDYVEGSEQQIGVSTVFLGLDHNFCNDGPPILWETMIFGTALDGVMDRYASKEAALRGHQEMLARVAEQYRKEHP